MLQQLTSFDPVRFKETTRQQWNSAAEAWNRWGPFLSQWLGPATELMLDMAQVGPGARVLDVAAGAGEQSVAAARRVGPRGYVLATDISAAILEFADENARNAGLGNVGTKVVDGERLEEVRADPFDAAISRVGLIYFPDQKRALGGMRDHLRASGRIGAMVYSAADKNPFFSLPVGIIRRRANLPPPAPGQPGPFSLGDPAVLATRLAEAGFRDVVIETVSAPLRLSSAKECVRFEKESFGALHQMLAGLSVDEREDAWAEVADALGQFERNGGFVGPCEMLVAAASK